MTDALLSYYFTNIDLIEPAENMIEQAQESLFDLNTRRKGNVHCRFHLQGLEDFEFDAKYDLIWTNWTLCHLTDDDLIKFLRKAHNNLRRLMINGKVKTGMIIIKGNFSHKPHMLPGQNHRVRTVA